MTKKKIFIVIGTIVLIFTLAVGIYLYKTRPMLSDSKFVIYTGYSKTISLRGRYKAEGWSSENSSVADVQNGVVTALSPGKTKITVSAGKKQFVCEVEVREAMSPKFFSIVEEEKKWFFSQQLSNGAFPNRGKENGEVSINPYFSALGIWCVLQCELTEEEINQIKEHLIWHFEHLNYKKDINGIKGTIYDYKAKIEDGKVIKEYSKDSYDSTDSYAAMFLAAIWKYYDITKDADFLKLYESEIRLVIDAMLSTMEKEYSYSRPDYKIVYLMDNSEVYEGLISSEKILKEIYEDSKESEKIADRIEKFEEKFNEVWWKNGYYSPYLNENHQTKDEKFSWDNFYPDAVSQLMPIIFGLADEEKAQKVYEDFCEYRNWETMDFVDNEESEFYWPIIMCAAAIMEDCDKTEKYIDKYLEKTFDKEYPLILSDCGWFIYGTNVLGNYYKSIEINSIK